MGARLFTKELTNGQSFVISNADNSPTKNCLSISYQMSGTSGDSGTIQGDFNLDPSTPLYQSGPITIEAGSGNTLTTSTNKPWTGITLTCVTGTLKIELAF